MSESKRVKFDPELVNKSLAHWPEDLFPETLTASAAAEILNVDRRYIIKLIEKGELPFDMGSRRLNTNIILEYRRRKDAQRAESLRESAKLTQELGEF